MPNPHFDVQIISRGKGEPRKNRRSAVGAAAYRSGTKLKARQGGSSAVAAAAYRSGETLSDDQKQKTYDYTRKEDIVHTEIMLPQNAPSWAQALSRERLWNLVEATEKRKDGQLARDVIASLPRELNREQQIALVREFVREQFTHQGMIADVAIHDKQATDGYSQPHVHIMLTLRDLGSKGFGKKNRSWNDPKLVTQWRNAWEECTNRHLAAAGRPERVSLKSNKERGINRTPQEYMGPVATKLEKRGIRTEKGERNRRIRRNNQIKDAVEGLLAETRPPVRTPGRQPKKPKREPVRSLMEVAKQQNQSDDSDARTKARDERLSWERFKRGVMTDFLQGAQAFDKRTLKAMMHSYNEHWKQRELDAAASRYSLLKTSKELSEELKQKEMEYER